MKFWLIAWVDHGSVRETFLLGCHFEGLTDAIKRRILHPLYRSAKEPKKQTTFTSKLLTWYQVELLKVTTSPTSVCISCKTAK